MRNRQANILFIPTSIGGHSAELQDPPSQRGYYERSIYALIAHSAYSVEGFRTLAGQLASVARQAYLARQIEMVEQATQVMCSLPIADQIEGIIRYYQSLCMWQRGNVVEARRSMEGVLDEPMSQYRARAAQIMGITYHESGDLDAAFPFYVEAGKLGSESDLPTLAESQRMIAVVSGLNGDHSKALETLERLFPLVRSISRRYPALYYDFLNSWAVELCEVGRLEEARNAVSIALASPFASAYPEWSDTRDEIASKRVAATPSVVAFTHSPEHAIGRNADSLTRPVPTTRKRLAPARQTNRSAIENRFLQRASVTIDRVPTIVRGKPIPSAIDQVLTCRGPRAPPTLQ